MTEMLDINTQSDGLDLPLAVTNEIWTEATKRSAVMAVSRRINLANGSGVTFPVMTGRPQAGWVGETEEAPVGEAGFKMKTMRTYPMSVILPFSNQFRRDWAQLYPEVRRSLPEALAMLFDGTVFGSIEAPGNDFDTLADAPTVQINASGEHAMGSLLEARATVAAKRGRVSNWLAEPDLESIMLEAAVAKGWSNPFDSATGVGHVLGAQVNPIDGGIMPAGFIGAAGDFRNSAVYGTIGNIRLSYSNDATVTGADGKAINLFQRGMFVVKADVEVGFIVRDVNHFVRLAGSPTALAQPVGFAAPVSAGIEVSADGIAGPFKAAKASK